MKKTIFIIIIAVVSFAAGYGTGNYNVSDFSTAKFSNENICPYLRNHQSAGSESECPYSKNKELQSGECPYLRNNEVENYGECPYLKGKATKPAGKEKIKTMQIKSS